MWICWEIQLSKLPGTGIMKRGAKAYCSPQPDGAMDVLFARAKEKGVELEVTSEHPDLKSREPNVRLGLSGEFQYKNANLAVAIAGAFLRDIGFEGFSTDIFQTPLPHKFRRGLEA